MTRITHLLGATADEQTRQIHLTLIKEIGPGFASQTRTIQPGGDYRNFAAAVVQLRRIQSDITYAWGIQSLAAAVISRQKKILFSPDHFAGKRALRWVSTFMSRGEVTMICPTYTQQRLAIGQGIDPQRCIVIAPGVDFGKVRQRRDTFLRRALGFNDNDIVVLAPGATTLESGHKQAVWACGILNVLDPAYKLLLWGRGSRAASVARLSQRLKQFDLVKMAEQTLGRSVMFEELITAADLCLATSTGACPTLPIATVMAGGVPIVSTVNYMLAELLEDRHTALMVPQQSPRALAQRIRDLRADDALSARMVETSRAEAYEHFSMTRMLDAYRRVFAGDLQQLPAEILR